MDLQPRSALSEEDVKKGLKLVIADGLATEGMTTFTGGAFLVGMALLLGASNFQIGLLAALPTVTNIFQLTSIWLVRRFNNRRSVTVFSSLLARVPLLLIGFSAIFDQAGGLNVLIFFLFFSYLFGSIAGPSWNSWMKDLVPEHRLGTYFSKRTSYTQSLNVVLSLLLAFAVDNIKTYFRDYELTIYGVFFILGGVVGIIGALILMSVPEPVSNLSNTNLFRLFRKPLTDGNFQRLLIFNSAWVFAVNIAVPFFIVFMMKSLGLPMSYIIGFAVVGQVAGILTVRTWGTLSDRYSNKTIIAISAPLYILCLIAWCFVGLYDNFLSNVLLLTVVHAMMGIANAGMNLSITNLGLKISPKELAIVYLTARNMVVSFFGSIAPLLGGVLADYFMDRSLRVDLTWASPGIEKTLYLLSLHEWNFLFLIGAILALVAVELLVHVREVGEVEKELVTRIMRRSVRTKVKDFFVIGILTSWHEHLWTIIKKQLYGTRKPE